MRRVLVLVGVMLAVFCGSVTAQTAASQPGFFPIEKMGIFAAGDIEVDVDLSGAALQVAAGAMENQDESLAELVSSLQRVRVQVGAPSGVDAAGVASHMADASAKLSQEGWQKMLSVEEADEQVYLYSLERDGNIIGLTGFVNEAGEEVVVVNIVGVIDPRTLGRLIASMKEIPDLEELIKAAEEPE